METIDELDMEVFVSWVRDVIVSENRVERDTTDARLTEIAEAAAVEAQKIFDEDMLPSAGDLGQVIFDLLCCEREDMRFEDSWSSR